MLSIVCAQISAGQCCCWGPKDIPWCGQLLLYLTNHSGFPVSDKMDQHQASYLNAQYILERLKAPFPDSLSSINFFFYISVC
jgi:hypothetical protein